MEVIKVLRYLGFLDDADAFNPSLRVSVLRSLRRRYQTKVSVATFVLVGATAKVEAGGVESCVEEFDTTVPIPSSNCFLLWYLI